MKKLLQTSSPVSELQFLRSLLEMKETSGWYVGSDKDLVVAGMVRSAIQRRISELTDGR
jgi:hypothetical protein